MDRIDAAIQHALDAGLLDLARDLNQRATREEKDFVPFSEAELTGYMDSFERGPLRKSQAPGKSPSLPSVNENSASEKSQIVQEALQVLGPLVNPLLRKSDGSLDLAKIKAEDFGEFKEFLKEQTSFDGIAFNQVLLDSYHKVLSQKEFEGLLLLLYREIHPESPSPEPFPNGGERRLLLASFLPVTALTGFKSFGESTGPKVPKSLPDISIGDAREVLKKFTAAIIQVSAEKFAGHHLFSLEGRRRLKGILRDELNFGLSLRADLIKAIGKLSEERGISPLQSFQLSQSLSSWDLFNWTAHPDKVSKATRHALAILEDGAEYDAQAQVQQKKYLENPDRIRVLQSEQLARALGPQDVQKMSQLAQVKAGAPDPLSQLQAKLAKMWLMAVDDELWSFPENYGATTANRAYVANHLESMLRQSELIHSQEGLEVFQGELQDFLHGPLHSQGNSAWNWIKHKTVGHGLGEVFENMPSAYQEPYQELLQYSDELSFSLEMGEKVSIHRPELQAEEPQLKQGVEHLIQGLEATKRSLWYQYKQHKAISRLGSQIAQAWEGGDLSDIRRANDEIDGMIERLSHATDKVEVEQEIQKLYAGLKPEQIFYKAFAAAEMEGTEHLIGLTQTVGIIMGTTVISGGLGAGAAVAETGVAVGRAANAFQMMSHGAKLGAWISFAENSVAVATNEVRGTEDTLLNWGKDSLATALATAAFGPLSMSGKMAVTQNPITSLAKHYFASGLKGVGHLAKDAIAETGEELMDTTTRRALDGQYQFMGWDQAREIVMVTSLGSAKMGALGHSYHWLHRAGEFKTKEVSHGFSPIKAFLGETATAPLGLVLGVGLGPLGPFPLKGLKKTNPLLRQALSRAKPIHTRLDTLSQYLRKVRAHRAGSPIQLEAAQFLPRLFTDRSPAIQDAARMAYLETAPKLPKKSHELEMAVAVIGRWLKDNSISNKIRQVASKQWMTLLLRLPQGNSMIHQRVKEILQTIKKSNSSQEPNSISLMTLERLLPKAADKMGILQEVQDQLIQLQDKITLEEGDRDKIRNLTGTLEARISRLQVQEQTAVADPAKLSDFAEALELINEFNSGASKNFLPLLRTLEQKMTPLNFRELDYLLAKTEVALKTSEKISDTEKILKGLGVLALFANHPQIAPQLRPHSLLLKYVTHSNPALGDAAGYGFKNGMAHLAPAQLTQLLRENPQLFDHPQYWTVVNLFESMFRSLPEADRIGPVLMLADRLKNADADSQKKILRVLKSTMPYLQIAHRDRLVRALQSAGDKIPAADLVEWAERIAELRRIHLGMAARSPVDVLEGLTSEFSYSREEARTELVATSQQILSAGERVNFFIQAGLKANGPELDEWQELKDTLEGIRESLDPRDAKLIDIGILALRNGKKVLTDYAQALPPGEVRDLEDHLFQNYLQGIPPEKISRENVPPVVLGLYRALQKRTDVSLPARSDIKIPDYLPAGAKEFPDIPPDPQSFSNPGEKILANLVSPISESREAALAELAGHFRSLNDPAQRLQFVIDLGKKADRPAMRHWEEFHEALKVIREQMDPNDVHLADAAIFLALEGQGKLEPWLNELGSENIESLSAHILETYLERQDSPEKLQDSPSIIQKIWPKLKEKKAASFTGFPNGGDLFALAIGLGTALESLHSSGAQLRDGISTMSLSGSFSPGQWGLSLAVLVGMAIGDRFWKGKWSGGRDQTKLPEISSPRVIIPVKRTTGDTDLARHLKDSSPTGNGLLPVGEGQPAFSFMETDPDHDLLTPELKDEIVQTLGEQRTWKTKDLYQQLAGLFKNQAKELEISLEVYLGRSLGRSGVGEVEAALNLLADQDPGGFGPTQQVHWIVSQKIPGGIPRLGKIIREGSPDAAVAMGGLKDFFSKYPAAVREELEKIVNDPNPRVAEWGMQAIVSLQLQDLISLLKKKLQSANSGIRFAAEEGLRGLKDKDMMIHWEALLSEPQTRSLDRARAAAAIADLGGLDRAIPLLKEAAADADPQTRFVAMQAIIKHRVKNSISSMNKVMEGMSPEQIIRLEKSFCSQGFFPQAEFLLQHLLQSGDVAAVSMALEAASVLRLKGLIPAILSHVKSSNAKLQLGAWLALAHFAEGKDSKRLLELIHFKIEPKANETQEQTAKRLGAQNEIRLRAAKSLLSFPIKPQEKQKVKRVVNHLMQETSDEVALGAAELWTQHWGEYPAIFTILHLLRVGPPDVAMEASSVLDRLSEDWDRRIRKGARNFREHLDAIRLKIQDEIIP